MGRAILTNRIYLDVNPELQQHLLRALTYKIPAYRPEIPPKIITNARVVREGLMSLPSGRLDLVPDDYEIVNRRVEVPCEFPDFKFTLRDNQAAIHDAVSGDCFINAPTSWGKTFSALKIIHKLKQKALVIVHTGALKDQWVEEVYKVFGFYPDIIGGGKKKWDTPVTIGMIQTLQRMNSDVLKKEFGTIVTDECHHCPSRTFSAVLDSSHAKYKIGLSASGKRKDGMHVVFPDFFSPKTFKPSEENKLKPVIHALKYPIRVPDGELAWALKINELANNVDYQRMIALTAASYVSKGHKVLVVSSRQKLLQRAHELTPNSVCIIGTTKDRKSEIQKMRDGTHSAIYGGISIFSEGVSENYLSCLIIATPINNEPLADQLVGRIVRHNPGKIQPVVVLPRLVGRVVEKQFQLMRGYFMRCGYEVVEL